MPFHLQPNLEGSLLTLRPLRAEDFADLYAVASDPLIWEQHPVRDRYKEDVFRALFSESLQSGGALIAIDREDGKVVGSSRSMATTKNAVRSKWAGRSWPDLIGAVSITAR